MHPSESHNPALEEEAAKHAAMMAKTGEEPHPEMGQRPEKTVADLDSALRTSSKDEVMRATAKVIELHPEVASELRAQLDREVQNGERDDIDPLLEKLQKDMLDGIETDAGREQMAVAVLSSMAADMPELKQFQAQWQEHYKERMPTLPEAALPEDVKAHLDNLEKAFEESGETGDSPKMVFFKRLAGTYLTATDKVLVRGMIEQDPNFKGQKGSSETNVFISYARKDVDPKGPNAAKLNEVRQSVDGLEGTHTFIDTEGLEGGDRWSGVLSDELLKSDRVLLFVSNTSLQRPEVLREFLLAESKGITVIPVLLEKEQLPPNPEDYRGKVSEKELAEMTGNYKRYVAFSKMVKRINYVDASSGKSMAEINAEVAKTIPLSKEEQNDNFYKARPHKIRSNKFQGDPNAAPEQPLEKPVKNSPESKGREVEMSEAEFEEAIESDPEFREIAEFSTELLKEIGTSKEFVEFVDGLEFGAGYADAIKAMTGKDLDGKEIGKLERIAVGTRGAFKIGKTIVKIDSGVGVADVPQMVVHIFNKGPEAIDKSLEIIEKYYTDPKYEHLFQSEKYAKLREQKLIEIRRNRKLVQTLIKHKKLVLKVVNVLVKDDQEKDQEAEIPETAQKMAA